MFQERPVDSHNTTEPRLSLSSEPLQELSDSALALASGGWREFQTVQCESFVGNMRPIVTVPA